MTQFGHSRSVARGGFRANHFCLLPDAGRLPQRLLLLQSGPSAIGKTAAGDRRPKPPADHLTDRATTITFNRRRCAGGSSERFPSLLQGAS